MEVFGTHVGSSPLDWVVHHSHESFILIIASHIFPYMANASADPSNHHLLSCTMHSDTRTCIFGGPMQRPFAKIVSGLPRIYMISTGFMVIGSNMLQSHLLSTTTMKRLLLGICWMTKDLPIRQGRQRERGKVQCGRENTPLYII